MIVRYTVTVADMVDVMRRATQRREPKLGWRWRQSVLISALLTAIFAGVIDGTIVTTLIASSGFFAVAWATMTYYQKLSVNSSFKRYVTNQYGASAPFTFEIEITSAGMTTRQLGEEVQREWINVAKITETIGGIEFDIHRGGMVFAADRGFKSQEERTEFLRLTKQYASGSSSPNRPQSQ